MTMMKADYKTEYENYKSMIEQRLDGCLSGEKLPQEVLRDAMRYSLLAGGKRIRPIMTLEFCRLSGKPPQQALDLACSVEMLHTYSLIHDDLPCMDNDDFRRGRPTNHRVFGEWQALLAGDALQAEAFNMILKANLPAENIVIAAGVLAGAAGYEGMCGGQYLDVAGANKDLTEEELSSICSLKTAALFMAACVMGCAAAGSTEEQALAAAKYGAFLGVAFQMRDDVLDLEGSFNELGKLSGSDQRNGKVTFATKLGIARCKEMISGHTEAAKEAIDSAFTGTDFLKQLADELVGRSN